MRNKPNIKIIIFKPIFLTLLCALLPNVIQSQNSDKDIDSVIETLTKIDNLYESLMEMEYVKVDTALSIYAGVEEWKDARNASRLRVSGLDFRAGYDRKFGDGTDDIYDDYYSYINRLYVMMSWNILDCGFIGRKAYEKRTDLKAQQQIIAEDNYHSVVAIRQASELQDQLLSGYYNKAYQTKIDLYNSLLALQQNLEEKRQSINIDSIEIEMRIAITQKLMRDTPIEVDALMDVNRYLSMQLVIDEQTIDSLLSRNYILLEKELEAKIVDSEADNISYWQYVDVSPYAKAQHYSGQGLYEANRTTANVGVTAIFPISTGTKKKKNEVEARAALKRSSASMLSNSIRLDLQGEVREINKNYEELYIAIKLKDIALQKVKQAHKSYSRKQFSIQDLAALYIQLLDSQIDIYKLIEERERLKSRLEIINNRT